MENKTKLRLTGFSAVMFSVLVMELLKRGGYLAGSNIVWRVVLAGALAGGFSLVVKCLDKTKQD